MGIIEERCSSRKLLHARRSLWTVFESDTSRFRKYCLVIRKAGIKGTTANVNARLSRTFQATEHLRLEAMVEAFNLLNHVNGVALNGSFGTGTYPTSPLPTFKQITAVADPRTLQFGLRLSF